MNNALRQQQKNDVVFKAFNSYCATSDFKVLETYSGTINKIFKILHKNQNYGLKIRVKNDLYTYEKSLIKDILLPIILDQDLSDSDISACINKILDDKSGEFPGPQQIPYYIPRVKFYDLSCKNINYPFCIYEWKDGTPLNNNPSLLLYKKAGELLAKFHKLKKFKNFYPDMLSFNNQKMTWHELFKNNINKLRTSGLLPKHICKIVDEINLAPFTNIEPHLVHNDFYCMNIITNNNEITGLVDWDNLVLDTSEFDLIKMKYWTVPNENKILSHNSELFSVFCSSYTSSADINENIFKLMELLWLCRVFCFEKNKEINGIKVTKGFPNLDYYKTMLEQIIA